jgi:hypothetical protein
MQFWKSYLFQSLAFETPGPLNASAIAFVNSTDRHFRALSDDLRETSVLFQRLSICVQRFNSVILQNSFDGDCRCSKSWLRLLQGVKSSTFAFVSTLLTRTVP